MELKERLQKQLEQEVEKHNDLINQIRDAEFLMTQQKDQVAELRGAIQTLQGLIATEDSIDLGEASRLPIPELQPEP